MKKFVILIPLYNDWKSAAKLLNEIDLQIELWEAEVCIVIVNDASIEERSGLDFNYKNIYFVGDALFTFPPSFAQGASQSIEAAKEAFEEINNNSDSYYEKRGLKIKEVNWRSKLNHFAFHLSNPIIVLFRNLILKILVNNKNFLNNYLGRIYKD